METYCQTRGNPNDARAYSHFWISGDSKDWSPGPPPHKALMQATRPVPCVLKWLRTQLQHVPLLPHGS
jgi:hypothetical protein